MKQYYLVGCVDGTGEEYVMGPFCEDKVCGEILEMGDALSKIIEGVEVEPEDLF